MSLEEERLRTEAAQRAQQSMSSSAGQEPSSSSSASASGPASLPTELAAAAGSGPAAAPAVNTVGETPAVGPSEDLKSNPIKTEEGMEEDEDADLAMALALSKGDDVEMEDVAGNDEDGDDEGLTEEEAIARAIALSMKEQTEGDQNK